MELRCHSARETNSSHNLNLHHSYIWWGWRNSARQEGTTRSTWEEFSQLIYFSCLYTGIFSNWWFAPETWNGIQERSDFTLLCPHKDSKLITCLTPPRLCQSLSCEPSVPDKHLTVGRIIILARLCCFEIHIFQHV